MFKILYPGMVLHPNTTQDSTLDDLGVVNIDSSCAASIILPVVLKTTKNLLDKSTTLDKSVVKVFESLQRAATIN